MNGGTAGAGDRRALAVQEVQPVLRVRPGSVEAHGEAHRAVPAGDVAEALVQERRAGGRLSEGEFGSSRLQVVAQEGGVVAVAGGVDADGRGSYE